MSAENTQAFFRGYCHSLDGATLFSKVISDELRATVKNEILVLCVKFGADLINISKSYRL